VSPTEKRGIKIAAQNRKAYHDYFVEDKYEAGIELFGTEVKSIRAGTVNLKEAWCAVEDGQLIVKQMHISPYEKGNIFNKDPMREKRLLMHKREILYLYGKVRRDGYTIVPLSVYFKNSRVKVEVGLCKGKQLHDKRETAAKRDAEREMDRAKKSFNRY
jgi:SsrA-binding protein